MDAHVRDFDFHRQLLLNKCRSVRALESLVQLQSLQIEAIVAAVRKAGISVAVPTTAASPPRGTATTAGSKPRSSAQLESGTGSGSRSSTTTSDTAASSGLAIRTERRGGDPSSLTRSSDAGPDAAHSPSSAPAVHRESASGQASTSPSSRGRVSRTHSSSDDRLGDVAESDGDGSMGSSVSVSTRDDVEVGVSRQHRRTVLGITQQNGLAMRGGPRPLPEAQKRSAGSDRESRPSK